MKSSNIYGNSIRSATQRLSNYNALFEQFKNEIAHNDIITYTAGGVTAYFVITSAFPVFVCTYNNVPELVHNVDKTLTDMMGWDYINNIPYRSVIPTSNSTECVEYMLSYFRDENQKPINPAWESNWYLVVGNSSCNTIEKLVDFYIRCHNQMYPESKEREYITQVSQLPASSLSEQTWLELPNWSTQYNNNLGIYVPPFCTINNAVTTLYRVKGQVQLKSPEFKPILSGYVVLDVVDLQKQSVYNLWGNILNHIPIVSGLYELIMKGIINQSNPKLVFPMWRTFGRDDGKLIYNQLDDVVYYNSLKDTFTRPNLVEVPAANVYPLVAVKSQQQVYDLSMTWDFLRLKETNKDFARWLNVVG